MNKTFRKIIAVILAVAMVLSMFSITSFAEDNEITYEYTNPYTLVFGKSVAGYEEQSVKELAFSIPHLTKYNLLDPATGTVDVITKEHHIFHLTDTVKVAAGPAAGEEGCECKSEH